MVYISMLSDLLVPFVREKLIKQRIKNGIVVTDVLWMRYKCDEFFSLEATGFPAEFRLGDF